MVRPCAMVGCDLQVFATGNFIFPRFLPGQRWQVWVWDVKEWITTFLNPLKGHYKYVVFRLLRVVQAMWNCTISASVIAHGNLRVKESKLLLWVVFWALAEMVTYFILGPSNSALLQGCADVLDAPPLLVPSTGRMNLENLLRDLPKYV